jgi:hypothetical protein
LRREVLLRACVVAPTTPRAQDDAAPAPPAAASDGRWTLAQHAEFAARRDFAFCQLLATDRRAFAVARRLRWGPQDARGPQPQHGGAAGAPPQGGQRRQQRGADAVRAPNHRQRASAARAARHRATLAAAAAAAAPAAAAAASPPTAASDVRMGDVERPSSPSRAAREEHALLEDASEQLASRRPRVQRGTYSYAASATGHAAPGRSI